MNELPTPAQEHEVLQSSEKKLMTAVIWSMFSNWSTEAIAALVTLILASVLKPADFGLVAMATVYVAFVEMVLGFGLDTAIIQKKQLTSLQLDSIFWMIVLASMCCCGLSVAISGWWARCYALPGLKPVIIVLSLGLPLQGLAIVQQSLFQRRMDFRSLAIRHNGAIIAGAIVGIGMAVSGFGVWALVGQTLSRQVIDLVLLWTLSKWRPSFRFAFSHTVELLSFSSKVFVSGIANFAQAQSDALLIGLFFGPTAVGVYRLCDRLIRMALKLLTRSVHIVALPHFSAFQHDREQLRSALISCWRKSSTITIPAMFLLAAVSDDFLRIIGPAWVVGADAVKLLALVGIAMSISLFTGPALYAAGRPGLQAWMQWILAIGITTSFILTGWLIHSLSTAQQVTVMAASRAAVFLLIFLPVNLSLAKLVSGVSYGDIFAATWRTILSGLIIFFLVRSSALALSQFHLHPFILLAIEAVIGCVIGITCMYLLDYGIRNRIGRVIRSSRGALFFSSRVTRHVPDV